MVFIDVTPTLEREERLEEVDLAFTEDFPLLGQWLQAGRKPAPLMPTTLTSLTTVSIDCAESAGVIEDPRAPSLARMAVQAGASAIREALLEPGRQLTIELSDITATIEPSPGSEILYAQNWLNLWWCCWITRDHDTIRLLSTVPENDIRLSSADGQIPRPWIAGLTALAAGDNEHAIGLIDQAISRTQDFWVADIDIDDHREYATTVWRRILYMTRALALGDEKALTEATVEALEEHRGFYDQHPRWTNGAFLRLHPFAGIIAWAEHLGLTIDVQSPLIPEVLRSVENWNTIPLPSLRGE